MSEDMDTCSFETCKIFLESLLQQRKLDSISRYSPQIHLRNLHATYKIKDTDFFIKIQGGFSLRFV